MEVCLAVTVTLLVIDVDSHSSLVYPPYSSRKGPFHTLEIVAYREEYCLLSNVSYTGKPA